MAYRINIGSRFCNANIKLNCMRKKISLIGAGQIGGTLAHLISIKELADVVLFDVADGIAKGKALDIAQSTSIDGLSINLIGTNNYEDIKNSDVIIITAGVPRKPGMTRDDLLEINLKIIKQVAEGIKKNSPNAFVICITNPLDVMVMALQRYSGLPKHKIVGMAGILDTSRFKYFLSQELKVPVKNIESLVLGGHGDTMVPMPNHTKVNGKSLNQLIKKEKLNSIIDRTRKGGAEIVKFLQKGSAFYAPAASGVEMAESYIKNLKNNNEEELVITDEKVITPGASLMQKDRNTNKLYIAYHSPKTPGKSYIYDIATKEKKLVKEEIVPSGHQPDDYIVERLNCDSHDGRKIPLTITRHKTTKLDGTANLLLYAYGSYGASMGPGFSSSRLSLINRNIIWVTAHIRGGMERGMSWWKEGKMLNKKNTFEDYISSAKFLIEKKYTSKGKIIGMGGSAGGLLMGTVVNQAPELFLGMIMAVPFVDTLTTNLNHLLPLTVGEFNEFGNAKENKEHFDYIRSYSPYENIKKMDQYFSLRTSPPDSKGKIANQV